MRRSRRGVPRWRVLLAAGTTTALLALTSTTAASATPGAPASVGSVSQTPPFWCQWIPPEWQPPECGTTPPPSTTSTTQPPNTTTTTTPGSTTTTTTPPGGNVEDFYEAAGPWAVTTGTASAPGTPGVTLTYPTNLGADGYHHPILVSGNGTGSSCDEQLAASTQAHIASWGFAVVCPNTGFTGTGNEIWAAVQWLIGQNANASSVFFGKLDTTSVGSFGHSQGASGAIWGTIKSNGVIDSTVGLALTDPWVHFAWSGGVPDMAQVDGPILLLSGMNDGLTSQGQQQIYYDEVPGPAAKAALVGMDHNGMITPSRAYVTAWFKYTLEDDQFARRAFVGSPPEINTNPAFTNQAEKSLP